MSPCIQSHAVICEYDVVPNVNLTSSGCHTDRSHDQYHRVMHMTVRQFSSAEGHYATVTGLDARCVAAGQLLLRLALRKVVLDDARQVPTSAAQDVTRQTVIRAVNVALPAGRAR
eukprot:scpid43871/ scgid23297/ 